METLWVYLQMGGHGGFIWASYGAVLVILFGLWLISRRFAGAVQTELAVLDRDRPHRQARQNRET